MKLIEDKQSLDMEKDFILRSIKTGYEEIKDAEVTVLLFIDKEFVF